MGIGFQKYMDQKFFTKFSELWIEAVKTTFNFLLNEDKVINGLRGRIQVARYVMRKACTKLQVRQDAKRLPYMNKSYCSQIEYFPRRYGYQSDSSRNRNLGIGYSSKGKKFKGYKRSECQIKVLKILTSLIKLLSLTKEG